MVGGGDTAIEEASFLTKFASRVTVIHRRDQLRASKIMQERAKRNAKISFLSNSVIEEILGTEQNVRKVVTGVMVRNVVTGASSVLRTDGVFMGIGHKPNTDLFAGQLEMDPTGYLRTEPHSTRTGVVGVFAAGDVADSVYRQAISAAGTGCMAAMDAEKYLSELYR